MTELSSQIRRTIARLEWKKNQIRDKDIQSIQENERVDIEIRILKNQLWKLNQSKYDSETPSI